MAAYVIGEVDVTDQASYEKAYVPGAMKAVADGGGTYLARGGATASLEVRVRRAGFIETEDLVDMRLDPAFVDAAQHVDRAGHVGQYIGRHHGLGGAMAAQHLVGDGGAEEAVERGHSIGVGLGGDVRRRIDAQDIQFSALERA